MFAVTGATGKLGRLVVEQLAKRVPAQQIVAVIRGLGGALDLARLGVHVREVDYGDPKSLAAAFKDVDKLLLISESEPGKRVLQHHAVVEAAARSQVSLLAYTSILRAGCSHLLLANEHRETEQIISKSKLPRAFLRNGFYIENYTERLEHAIVSGKILGSAKQGRIAGAPRIDYAEAAAVVLTSTQRHEVYELAGDDAFTLSELAAQISRVTGKSVRYQDLPPSAYREALIGADVPALDAEFLVDMNIQISRGALDDDTRTLSKLIGRPTTPLAAALQAWRDKLQRA